MSTAESNEESDDAMQLCASCGVAGGDDIKLKNCDDCDLVRYCGVKCQREHRSKHKMECKKRAAELKDELLFQQPESTHDGDCPICCLPVPIDPQKSTLTSCCSKMICVGCIYANAMREIEERLLPKCPFCRKAWVSKDDEEIEINKQLMKRVEVNDPVAMYSMGTGKYKREDYKAAFGYLTKAAAMGNIDAHFQLSRMYDKGEGVEKDERKEMHHLEQAAIGGHPQARYNLAIIEERKNRRVDRAVKHYIIAANLGCDDSLSSLKNAYKAGLMSKDDFAAALRGYQTAINTMKSPQREEATKFFKKP